MHADAGIGRAGTASDECDTRLACHRPVGTGHEGHSAFLPTGHDIDLGGIHQRIEHGEKAFSRNGENPIAALLGQAIDEEARGLGGGAVCHHSARNAQEAARQSGARIKPSWTGLSHRRTHTRGRSPMLTKRLSPVSHETIACPYRRIRPPPFPRIIDGASRFAARPDGEEHALVLRQERLAGFPGSLRGLPGWGAGLHLLSGPPNRNARSAGVLPHAVCAPPNWSAGIARRWLAPVPQSQDRYRSSPLPVLHRQP